MFTHTKINVNSAPASCTSIGLHTLDQRELRTLPIWITCGPADCHLRMTSAGQLTPLQFRLPSH